MYPNSAMQYYRCYINVNNLISARVDYCVDYVIIFLIHRLYVGCVCYVVRRELVMGVLLMWCDVG